MSSSIKKILPLFLVILLNFSALATNLMVKFKVQDQAGNFLKDSYCNVYLNDNVVSTHRAKKGIISFTLDYDKKYDVKVFNKGFTNYLFNFNAALIQKMKMYDYEYTLSIKMIPQKEGYDVKHKGDPITRVAYNKQKDKFSIVGSKNSSYSYVLSPNKKSIPKDTMPKNTTTDIASNIKDIPKPKEETPLKASPPNKKPEPVIIEPKAPSLNNKDQAKLAVQQNMIKKLEIRDLKAKNKRAKIEALRVKDTELTIKLQNIMASKKRKLIEEIAESNRSIKQLKNGFSIHN